MPRSFQRDPRVVVEEDVLRPPINRDRETGAEADADSRYEALRPGVQGPEGCTGPVERLHERADSASGRENRLLELRAHREQASRVRELGESCCYCVAPIVTDCGRC